MAKGKKTKVDPSWIGLLVKFKWLCPAESEATVANLVKEFQLAGAATAKAKSAAASSSSAAKPTEATRLAKDKAGQAAEEFFN